MSELRTRMIRDMALRGFSPRTHEAYIAAVVKLAKYYHRAPDQLSDDEVQRYLAHVLQERKLSWSTCSQAAHAFRFLYHVTLGRAAMTFHVPAPKQPQKLPDILSREEVWRLLRACTHPWHRLLLATTYAGGLRVSEVVALKVADLDADRMTIHIVQGKGGNDCYVPLSQRLLQDWRAYWRIRPPHVWLFANRQGTRPIDITVAQKLYIVPDGFVRIRHFGLFANRRRAAALARCRVNPPPALAQPESVRDLLLRVTGLDIDRCPLCQQGLLRSVALLPPAPAAWDTS
jgi:site-specific recombinase XerD